MQHYQESHQGRALQKQPQSQEQQYPMQGGRSSSLGRERADPPQPQEQQYPMSGGRSSRCDPLPQQQQHPEQLSRQGSRPSSRGRGRLEPQADNVDHRRPRSQSRDGGRQTTDSNVPSRPRSRSRCSSTRGDFNQSVASLGSRRDHNHSNASLGGRCDFTQSLSSLGGDARCDHGQSSLSLGSGCGRPVTGILRNGKNSQDQSHRNDGHQPHHHETSLHQHPQHARHQQHRRRPSQGGGNESNAHLLQHKMHLQKKESRDNWKDQSFLSRAESHTTESETSPESESTTFLHESNDSFHHRGETLLEPSLFDDRGRCARHPHIRLRKKKMMGGWKIILVNCPDCCIEGMLRMRLEAGDGGNNGGLSKSASRGESGVDKNSKSMRRKNSQDGSVSSKDNMPPISQLIIRKQSDSSVISETTYSTPPEDSRGSTSTDRSGSGRFQAHNSAPQDDPRGILPPPAGGLRRVRRMPFTDAYGDKGWYTGEVASGSGLPHGRGTLHYCDGRVHNGRWSNGLAASAGSSPGGGGTTNKKTNPVSPGALPPSHSPYGSSKSLQTPRSSSDVMDLRCNIGPSRHDHSPSVNHTRPTYPSLPEHQASSPNKATFDYERLNGKGGHHYIGEADQSNNTEEEFQDWFRRINGLDASM